ncbi:DMT family transporter [Candidatus Puniceispirillum marinum]|uniref:Membrane protein n=1 Tax=Puniceispirillum marinum (strain IMCC1322) TaxID=488538 RepID=D5BTU5_PUNMI|nr:DMT family transporter [Candidatus Puniceispirillum marinum]ADE39692.1 membrane protein [Candidatus Puniceispirillum marinum IMCC1322]
MRFSNFTSHYSPATFGTLLAILGVLILTPDTLVMRLSGLEKWPLMGWRGILMGVTLLCIWRLFPSQNRWRELRSLGSWQGILVIIAFGFNSITFTLGIAETSVIVVLTAVALMPLIAAMLSFFMLGEKQGWLGWLTIMLAMLGVIIVVMDGGNALGQPQGSVWLGAVFGLVTAFGLALTFTITRKYPALSILPACALGSLLSGIVGFALSADGTIFTAPVWTIVTMGIIILPLSFTCLGIAPRYTSSAIVSLVMLLEMVIGPFWVWLGIGERPTTTMIAGSLFVLCVLIFHVVRTSHITPPTQP